MFKGRDDLRYGIGADTSSIDAAWSKIRSDAQATGAGINAAMGRARSGIDGLAAPLRAIPALFAAIGATAIVSQMRQTAEAVADIGRQAKMAGLDVEAFQELKFVAEQNRIGVDVLADGMKELSLRADEFIATGRGPAAEAFGRLGFSSEELARKLKNPSALLTEIIGKLETFDQAARIRITDELFGGTAGERFVELVDQGERGIREQIQAARDLGLVLDEDVIDKADEVDRKFNLITTTISTGMKQAIVEAADAWFKFLDSFNEFEKQQSSTLADSISDIDRERLDLENQILEKKREQANLTGALAEAESRILQGQINSLQERIDSLAAEGSRKQEILESRRASRSPQGVPSSIDTSTEFIRRYREELALSSRERSIAAEAQRILNEASGEGARLTEEQARQLAEEAIRRKEAEAATKGSAKTLDKEADSYRKVIAALEFEQSLLGKSEAQKRIANELRRAGVDAATMEGRAIAALVSQIEAETAASERAKEAEEARTESLTNLFQMGEDALLAMIDNSMKAEDAFKRLAIQLALAAAQAALLGTGPLAGLFGGGGGLFGGGSSDPWAGLRIPGFASGTNYAPGGLAWVGEKGPELVNLPRGSQVIPNVDLAPAGGASTYAPQYNIDARGAEAGVEQKIAAMLREYDRGSFRRWVSNQSQARKRNVI